MDNIDKMVIDDMIKTAKEHLYISSPVICFFLILAGAVFDLTFLMILGLIVILVFFVSLAVKKIQKEYDKRTEIYLELTKNADILREALLEDNFHVHQTTYSNSGDVEYIIRNKTTNEKKTFMVNSKYVSKFDDMVNLDYDKFLKPCDD
jgi:type II secretory pathway component PulF